jgi:hypothetical protein
VTGTLQRLRQAGRLAPDAVSVQLVVVPVGAAASARRMELLVGEVDLIVTPATAPDEGGHPTRRCLRIATWTACCGLALAAAVGAEGGGAGKDGAPAAEGAPTLSFASPTLRQPVAAPSADAQPPKHVEVELARIANAARIPIRFEVHFRSTTGERTLLGTFGPYPPDRPGKFLVPVAGRIRGAGELELTMHSVGEARTGGEALRVEVGGIALRAE